MHQPMRTRVPLPGPFADPLFTAVARLPLALRIALTLISTAVDALLLRPVPVEMTRTQWF
jgi:hypothetical protein